MLDVTPAFRRRTDFRAAMWRALGWPARVFEARRTLSQLAQMSDRELSDLGLLRADLADCTALAPDDDPAPCAPGTVAITTRRPEAGLRARSARPERPPGEILHARFLAGGARFWLGTERTRFRVGSRFRHDSRRLRSRD